jgi:hypothetical protein
MKLIIGGVLPNTWGIIPRKYIKLKKSIGRKVKTLVESKEIEVEILIEIYKEKYRSAPKIIFKDSYKELDTLTKLSLLSNVEKELGSYKKELTESFFQKMMPNMGN